MILPDEVPDELIERGIFIPAASLTPEATRKALSHACGTCEAPIGSECIEPLPPFRSGIIHVSRIVESLGVISEP